MYLAFALGGATLFLSLPFGPRGPFHGSKSRLDGITLSTGEETVLPEDIAIFLADGSGGRWRAAPGERGKRSIDAAEFQVEVKAARRN